MRDNIISETEGLALLEKLFSERIPVRAFLAFPIGTSATVRGFVSSITRESGIVIAEKLPLKGSSAHLKVAFFGRTCEFTFGDSRDLLQDERDEWIVKFGDTILCLRFTPGEMLVLTFNTLAP